MPNLAKAWRFFLLAGLVLLNAACHKQEAQTYEPQYTDTFRDRNLYHFAVHPLYNPEMLSSVFTPLMEYLNERIPNATFQLEASRDYTAFEDKIRRRSVEFLLPNPYQTLLGQLNGYHVFAKMGNDADFHGIFITRRDSGIHSVSQLKGKTISYPAPTAIAATMLPQQFLQDHGIDVNSDIANIYVGSQESSILAAYHRQADVAATWPPPWRNFVKDHPREAAQLKVLWQTPSLPNNSFMARNDVAADLVQKVRKALLDMPTDPVGRKVLQQMAMFPFEMADDNTYLPVRQFIRRFNKAVRPLDTFDTQPQPASTGRQD